jgi:hypothetical protein
LSVPWSDHMHIVANAVAEAPQVAVSSKEKGKEGKKLDVHLQVEKPDVKGKLKDAKTEVKEKAAAAKAEVEKKLAAAKGAPPIGCCKMSTRRMLLWLLRSFANTLPCFHSYFELDYALHRLSMDLLDRAE